jgi:uncharacterized protein (TIGR03435 family)
MGKLSLWGCVILSVLLLDAQAPAELKFDVTSVKQNKLSPFQRHSVMECSGNRFMANGASLLPILRWAYHIDFFQQPQMPPPFDLTVFDIEARAARAVSQDQCRLMVQNLLADRFKMRIHRESKQVAVYALTVAKNGPQMTKVTEGTKDAGSGFTVNGRPMPGAPETGYSMEILAGLIGNAVNADRPVIDRTGLEGFYKIKLDVTISADDNTSLGAAARQLGLRVEERTEPFVMLKIDHLEMPDEN